MQAGRKVKSSMILHNSEYPGRYNTDLPGNSGSEDYGGNQSLSGWI